MTTVLAPGRRAWLCYSGVSEWHERLILGHVAGREYVVASPDLDLFVEQIDNANVDLDGVRVAPAAGTLPIGLPGPGMSLYGFAPLSAAVMAQLMSEGAEQAQIERESRGLGGAAAGVPVGAAALPVAVPAGPAPALAIVAVPVGAPAAAAPVAGAGPAGRLPRVVAAGGRWVLDEPIVGHEVGEEFNLPLGAVQLGNRALVSIGSEVVVLKQLAAGASVDAYAQARRALLNDDIRILPSSGRRPRTLAQAVELMTKSTRDNMPLSPLTSPDTQVYFLESTINSGQQSLIARDSKWKAESGVNAKSQIAYEHGLISRALEYGATIDGLNLKNLVMADLLMKRLQLHEEAVAECPEAPNYEGADHYLGIVQRAGGTAMDPNLRSYVASELGKEAAIMKEKRKAQESRTALKGGGGYKGKGKGGGKDAGAAPGPP
jgi:hypothetical protein